MKPKQDSALAGVFFIGWLMGGFIGTIALGQWVGETYVVPRECGQACGAHGSTFDHLFIGGRSSGPSACVCADGSQSPTDLVDLIMGVSVGLAFVVAYGPVAIYARPWNRPRNQSSKPPSKRTPAE